MPAGEDVRAALSQAAAQVPHPGPRLRRWQGRVPDYAAGAGMPEPRRVRAAEAVAVALWRLHRGRPVRRAGLAAWGMAAAALLVALVSAGGARHIVTLRHRHLPVSASRIELVSAATSTCPIAESRYDDIVGGFHLCLPAAWTTRDYTSTSAADRAVNLTGLDDAVHARAARVGDEGPDAAVMITVWVAGLDDVAANDGLNDGVDVPVAGTTGVAFDRGGSDPNLQRRVVLVEHGSRTYEIEQLRPGVVTRADLEEVLRTFAFQGLPFYADPDFRLNRASA